MNNDLQLVPYGLEAATIEALKSKYMDVVIQPDDKAAYAMVMSGLRECREIRLAVDSWHKERKERIVKAGKHYDAERRRVHALVSPIEDHLIAARQVEDGRKEVIRAEAERKELERVEGIRAKIEGLKQFATINLTMTASRIAKLMDDVADIIIDKEVFGEFLAEAERVKAETWETLAKREKERSEWEAEQAAAKAEAERLEKVRKEQEAARKALDEEARKIKEAQAKIDAEKKALEDAKKAEKERQDRVEFERKAQEEAKARAEQAYREKVEREAREELERAEKEKVETARREALRPDKEKLLTLADRIEKVIAPEVSTPVAKEIIAETVKSLERVANKLRKQAKEM